MHTLWITVRCHGTLTGYRDGAVVAPIPDGTCDITAHVALDACAEAGRRAGAISTGLSTQRDALGALGVTGTRPPIDLAHADPPGYLRALARASEEGELIDAEGSRRLRLAHPGPLTPLRSCPSAVLPAVLRLGSF